MATNWWVEPLVHLLTPLKTATVLCRDEAFLNRVDDALWRTPQTSFLPHGSEEGEPIYLSTKLPTEQVESLVLLALPQEDTALGATTSYLMFNDQEQTLSHARKLWKHYQNQNIEQSYWEFTSTGFSQKR